MPFPTCAPAGLHLLRRLFQERTRCQSPGPGGHVKRQYRFSWGQHSIRTAPAPVPGAHGTSSERSVLGPPDPERSIYRLRQSSASYNFDALHGAAVAPACVAVLLLR